MAWRKGFQVSHRTEPGLAHGVSSATLDGVVTEQTSSDGISYQRVPVFAFLKLKNRQVAQFKGPKWAKYSAWISNMMEVR